MTSFQLPSTLFPENAIKRAERSYQNRTARRLHPRMRWLMRTFIGMLAIISMIEFFGLLIASLLARDPSPLFDLFRPFSTLLILLTIFYHLSLMFQTISLTAHSITREKEAQTWETLILTGIDARQIVRGKWWATVQRQLPRYAILALLRAGMTVALSMAISNLFAPFPYRNYGQIQLQLPHPITVLASAVIGAGYTFASLGLSAACGVMTSAASNRSTVAILRGFASQFLISLVMMLSVLWIIDRLIDPLYMTSSVDVYVAFSGTAFSFVDNGIIAGVSSIGAELHVFFEQVPPPPIKPIAFDWIIAGILGVAAYTPLVWYALSRAENNAVKALATAAKKP